jgi:hypothetical protein
LVWSTDSTRPNDIFKEGLLVEVRAPVFCNGKSLGFVLSIKAPLAGPPTPPAVPLLSIADPLLEVELVCPLRAGVTEPVPEELPFVAPLPVVPEDVGPEAGAA